jgi:hypothetical protein
VRHGFALAANPEGVVKQECGVGIVDIDVSGAVPAFAAPKTTIAPLPPENLEAITSALCLPSNSILRTAQLANGPVWEVLQLASAADVLAADSSKIRYPEFLGVGLIGALSPGSECQFEARNLAPSSGDERRPDHGLAERGYRPVDVRCRPLSRPRDRRTGHVHRSRGAPVHPPRRQDRDRLGRRPDRYPYRGHADSAKSATMFRISPSDAPMSMARPHCPQRLRRRLFARPPPHSVLE